MGLLAEFTMSDIGYAEETEELGLYIDYSAGCEAFVTTFLEVARTLVPVDTGRLLGSISANTDGEGCTCIADCEYAQYVEYGTVYMGAQPYFEPAIVAGLFAAFPYWDEAVDLALEEEEELLEEMEEAERTARQGRQRERMNKMGAMSFGGILGLIIGAIIVGLIQGFFNLISGRGDSSSSRGSIREGSGDLKGYMTDIEIEII